MGCVVYILSRDYYRHRLLIRYEAVIMIGGSSHCRLSHDSSSLGLLSQQRLAGLAFVVDADGSL